MIARFRDFICKIQVKIQKQIKKGGLVGWYIIGGIIYQPPFFHLSPLFRQSNFIPP